jgi:MFS family permease
MTEAETEQEPHLSLARERRFHRLLAAEWASVIGDFALVPVIPFAVYALGGSTGEVAAVFGAEYLALSAIVLFGGVAGDRFSRRRLMVTADLARFVVQAAVALSILLGAAAVWQLVAAQLALGVGSAVFRPALTGLVRQTLDDDRNLQSANSARGMAEAMGSLVGPAVGGVALALGSAGWAYAVDACTFLVSAAFLYRLSGLPEPAAEPEASIFAEVQEGWQAFRKRTWVWAVVLGFGVLNALVFAPFYVLGPQIITNPSAWSTVLVWAGAGALCGGLLTMRWHPGRPLLVATLAVALWIPLAVLLAAGASLALLSPTAALGGAALAVFSALWNTALQDHIPEDQISRVSSYDWIGSMGLLPIGYVVAWGMSATIGAEGGLLAGAVVLLLTTTTWAAVGSIRRLRPAIPQQRTVQAMAGATGS